MKIIIKAKNLELTGALEQSFEEKVETLQKFIDILKDDDTEVGKTLAEVFVEVEKETKHHKKGQIFSCQLEVSFPGKSLVTKSESDDLYKAVVGAKNDLEEVIKKYKFKNIEKTRRLIKKTKNEIIV